MPSDGDDEEWSPVTDRGFERCVRCGVVFGAEHRDDDIRAERHGPGIGSGVNYTYGPVRSRGGTEYSHVNASPPGTHLLHEDCWAELDAERRAAENRSLAEYAAGGAE